MFDKPRRPRRQRLAPSYLDWTKRAIMKRKIGTYLEEDVYFELKRRATEEGRLVDEIIQTAVKEYLQRPAARPSSKSGLRRFLARKPFKLAPEQFKESLEADHYDQ